MERPLDNCETVDLWKYIAYLEGCLNGSSELISSLNHFSNVLAGDIRKIADGEDIEVYNEDDENGVAQKKERTTLILLAPEKNDKTFDKIMKLINGQEHIKKMGAVKVQSLSEVDSIVKKGVTLKAGDNFYEHALAQAKKNGRPNI